MQAAESDSKHKHLLKEVADVQGDNSLAASLLHALHLKVAHMQGMNESLRVKIASMEQQADAQVNKQDAVLNIIVVRSPVLSSNSDIP